MNLQAEPLNLKEATVTCIPRLRGGGGGRRSRRGAAATQVSMLDRVRDVVLRLAMVSAASAATTTAKQGAPGTLRRTATTASASATATPSRAAARVSPAASVAYTDSYRSEAVDDCIEFLKRSAAGGAPATAEVEASTAASPLHATAACAM
ncbi:hypothetical protein PAHAL_7G014000 [Panicum hallii]|uniref:Uncharacterized protein n=1 Tax=Panicum hallii TaxID=206008 RepID=A0A2T8IAL4_9POAL|nr:uncharacterized protein LOC112899475 [Panicum hallii]PVH34715.1 hypothetical protein PAHAL_7G014000 [Panicum hallii]